MTMSELAKKLNLSVGYLSEIEAGKKTPSLSTIKKYADIFGTKESAIMFFADTMEKESKTKKSVRGNIIKFLETIENIKVENDKSKKSK